MKPRIVCGCSFCRAHRFHLLAKGAVWTVAGAAALIWLAFH